MFLTDSGKQNMKTRMEIKLKQANPADPVVQ